MHEVKSNQGKTTERADPRWKELYRVGALACLAFPVSIIIAIIIFFIWSYAPGTTTVADIFGVLQNNRLAGLLSLEVQVILLLLVMPLYMLAVYGALKRANESYALIALVLGLMGVVLWLVARPVAEMVYLSERYAAATSEAVRRQYLAAGETFYALFDGTAWLLSQVLIAISSLINSLLMVRGAVFSKATAYVGIGLSVIGLGFWLPGIGVILSLLGTMGGVVWYLLMARDFYRMGWSTS